MANIYEDRLAGKWGEDETAQAFKKSREELMADMYGDEAEAKIKRTDEYLSRFINLKTGVAEEMREWEEIEDLCRGAREDNGSGEEDSFVNVILPNIEGQVASMTNYNISAMLKGKGISDQKFVKTAEPIIDFILKENKIRTLVKDSGRPYCRLGNALITVGWDSEAFNGMGMPEIKVRDLPDVLFDGKVRKMSDLNHCDYILEEAGQFSILWASREYGDEVAKCIQLGNAMVDFQKEYEMDDSESFTMKRVWTKMNQYGNLQMLLMSACGVLLEESDEKTPYHSTVFNRYPVFITGLYPRNGHFYRYGDGLLLAPIQKLINKLYDEIILSMKFASQGRTYIDPMAKVKPDEFSECDPSKFIVCASPNSSVLTSRGTGINEGVYRILEQLFTKVQEVTRFSTLMTGQSGESRTATEAGILMQQGATGIDDKKGDISTMLSDAVLYAFGLCLENWSAGVALRITEDKDDFVWIDTEQLKAIPKMIPASEKYLEQWKKAQPKRDKSENPKWMTLEVDEEEPDGDPVPEMDEAGQPVMDELGMPKMTQAMKKVSKSATQQICLDLSLTIGEGMPTNKVSMYNILLSLSQLTLIDEMTMQPKPLLTRQRVVSMLEDILGIQIDEDEEGNIRANGQPLTPPQPVQPPVLPPINQDANVPNANVSGSLAGGM